MGGGYRFAQGATLTGTNAARIIGNVVFDGAVAAKNVEQAAGTLTGGGTLTVESVLGQGSIFCFTLPYRGPASTA